MISYPIRVGTTNVWPTFKGRKRSLVSRLCPRLYIGLQDDNPLYIQVNL